MMPVNPLKVLVAEDQRLLRLGIVQALSGAGYEVVAQTEDGPTTLRLAAEVRPGIVVLKIDLPGSSGAQCARQLKTLLGPEVAIMMTLQRPSDFWAALDSGADGYTLRETLVDLLPHAIRQISQGLGWIGPNIAQYLVKGRGLPLLIAAANRFAQAPVLAALSDREQDVVHLLLEGASNESIAQTLGLKRETVKVHVKSILKKLGAGSRAEAISLILKTGSARARPGIGAKPEGEPG